MKLYQSIGPNPRVVTMFIAEKGIAVPRQTVDIMSGENRQPADLALNATGGLPILLCDDGTVIPESIAICEYLEERHPAPALIGADPAARAATRAAVSANSQKGLYWLYGPRDAARYLRPDDARRARGREVPLAAETRSRSRTGWQRTASRSRSSICAPSPL